MFSIRNSKTSHTLVGDQVKGNDGWVGYVERQVGNRNSYIFLVVKPAGGDHLEVPVLKSSTK